MTDATLDPLFLEFQQALVGRYSIDRELGRGGMGVVYLAREVHLDRLVAIKVLPPERAAQPLLRQHFLGEARLAAKLSHPNIIPIHAVEERNGFVFYVMAFVDGETLAQRVRDRGPLPVSEGTRVLREVAWALAYAHAQGLVHRDVKPDNILIESTSGRVLVADFGIAAAVGEVSEDGISGTPEFMSPEQALGGRIDARSDLYGLGVTGYFTFSGRFPFEGENATQILAKQVTEAPPPLASLGLTVPRKLALLIEQCLAKEPDQRPATAELFASQIATALEQRREVPLPLRAFVKRRGRITVAGVLLPGAGLMLLQVLAYKYLHAQYSIRLLGLALIGLVLVYLMNSARQLLQLGYDHRDLHSAFRAQLDQTREDLGEEHRPLVRFAVPTLGVLSKVSGLVALMSVVITLSSELRLAFIGRFGHSLLEQIVVFSGLITALSYYIRQALRRQTRDIETESWAKVWNGWLGKTIFAVTRNFVNHRSRGSAMTHRATELSLGMAAEQLFETLPKESQRALADLPKALKRLQADAQLLRARHEELQGVLGSISDATVASEFADLAAARDAVRDKLGEAVGALETIRLNLLRLHAGSVAVTSLTTHLGMAAQVSADVERLIEAHLEVDLVISYPRLASNSG